MSDVRVRCKGQISGSEVKVRFQGQMSGSDIRCRGKTYGSDVWASFEGQISGSHVDLRYQGKILASVITFETISHESLISCSFSMMSSPFNTRGPLPIPKQKQCCPEKFGTICPANGTDGQSELKYISIFT